MRKIRVLVWNEYIHELRDKTVQAVYGKDVGIHGHIAKFLKVNGQDLEVKTATLNDDDDAGLSEENLKNTDVLIWWGHAGHEMVLDEFVDRIQKRILEGMGLIVLHSGHFSKIFKRMMGTSCGLMWREAGERELIWVVNPYHPITRGIDPVIELPHTEMYGEVFDIPNPDDVLFISNFEGGEVFRSGCTFHRGRGKIFYWRPGHETFPIYTGDDDGSKQVLQVILNACRWCGTYEGNDEASGVGTCVHQGFHLAPIKKHEFTGLTDHPESSGKGR
ncbi:MAG: ThuA domain-containing protein [Promethearchaeota archaeon]